MAIAKSGISRYSTVMLHSFSCTNFYSFRHPITVDFTVNGNAPDTNAYVTAKSGTRLSKTEMVIGPNAAGKSNLLKVPSFLRWLIIDSFGGNIDAPLPFKPFAFRKNEEPTELSAAFEIDGTVYTYAVTLTKKRIISEKLDAEKRGSAENIFVRRWNEKENMYTCTGAGLFSEKNFQGMIRENAGVISTAAQLNQGECRAIVTHWSRMRSNVVKAGWSGDSLTASLSAPNRLLHALNLYSENEGIKEEVGELLRRFDIGFSSFKVERDTVNDGPGPDGHTVHTVDGTDYTFALNHESSGTKQLMTLFADILMALHDGGIAVIDELDVNLHSRIMIEILNLFLDPETNPHNAQIFLSSQNHSPLKELDACQVILIRKDERGVSDICRLDNVEGVHSDENFYARYSVGAYGAVPDIG